MKRKLILPLVCGLISTASFSQVSLGVQAGGTWSKTDTRVQSGLTGSVSDYKAIPGFSGGLVADIPFGQSGFRLVPELSYVLKGVQADATANLFGQSLRVSAKQSIGYLELPVNLAFAIPVGSHHLVIGAGPYGGYGVSGKTTIQSSVNSENTTEEMTDVKFGKQADELKRMDYGANAMVGFIMNNGLMFKLNYSYGLADLSNDSQLSHKNRYFGLSAAYFYLRGEK